MAPRYSNKKAKYTYTERVLGALSDIQREHRKHAVHMATLRAHIRKTADSRKDRMGPQWSQWVSRTVQKLADDGILDTTDSHGNVTFTPHAKKTITAARRESLGPGIVPSQSSEHKIWKDVTRRFSAIGIKRQRGRPSVNSTVDEEEAARPRKRHTQESFSGLTKVELERKLCAALEKLREAEEPRAEPRSQERELAVLRDEIMRLKDQSTGERRVTIGTTTRPMTPTSTYPSESSSPNSNPVPDVSPRTTVHGMTRTLSGSVICNLSKRPTPEPSESDSQEVEFEATMFDHTPDQPPASDLAKDDGSFLCVDQGFELALRPETRMLSNPNHHGLYPGDDNQESGQDNHPASSTTENLRDHVQSLLAERDTLRALVASRDSRLERLEADLRCRSDDLSDSQRQTSQLEETLRAERTRLQEAEASLQESRNTVTTGRNRYSALEEKHSNLRDVINGLQGKVEHLTLRTRSLEADLEGMQQAAAGWETARHESEVKLARAHAEVVNYERELSLERQSVCRLKCDLETSKASNHLVHGELSQAKADLAYAEERLADAERLVVAGNAVQASMSSQIKELKTELKHSQDQLTSLYESKHSVEAVVNGLEDTVKQMRKEISHAKDQTASISAQLEQSQDVIDGLRASHAQVLSDASASARETAALKVNVSELESTIDILRSQLVDAAAETAGVRRDLETVQVSRRCAESELVASQEELGRLLADKTDKTAQLAMVTKQLDQARRAQEEVDRQIERLCEERKQDWAAHCAEKSALESGLVTARSEAADLEGQVQACRVQLSSLSAEMHTAVASKDALLVELADERQRASTLQVDLLTSLDDLRDAEEEISELREAKAADEASIQGLKGLLARLRQVQLDAMEEVNNKMISAQTAPTPGHRRRSSIALRQSVDRHA